MKPLALSILEASTYVRIPHLYGQLCERMSMEQFVVSVSNGPCRASKARTTDAARTLIYCRTGDAALQARTHQLVNVALCSACRAEEGDCAFPPGNRAIRSGMRPSCFRKGGAAASPKIRQHLNRGSELASAGLVHSALRNIRANGGDTITIDGVIAS